MQSDLNSIFPWQCVMACLYYLCIYMTIGIVVTMMQYFYILLMSPLNKILIATKNIYFLYINLHYVYVTYQLLGTRLIKVPNLFLFFSVKLSCKPQNRHCKSH